MSVKFKALTSFRAFGNQIFVQEVLHLLSCDPGLQALMPRFALIIFEGVRCNIAEQKLPVLRNILRLVKTLVDNPQVNIDKCLNDIIPALCLCVVCREFSADPEDKRHFRLREFTAVILANICKRPHLADVRARVTTFLCRMFTDSRANLASLYGALYALGELGCEVLFKYYKFFTFSFSLFMRT
ncbi:Transcription initiation factor TFIID subunit 6 [Parelaphostrongylus tenuis]|uniref:Transcription initiation factor TFIID subunit 6 n=1 Tax=Parelaphostrongylus tenuis TaxID=148309 RepID=A0AAD5WIG3_PARTN|nr:Transcription initiation factor TFIID subunit 6 [Parelaphostrongylus tenuis]